MVFNLIQPSACQMFHIFLIVKKSELTVAHILLSAQAIIAKAFQGSMRIFSKKLPHPDLVSVLLVLKSSLLPSRI